MKARLLIPLLALSATSASAQGLKLDYELRSLQPALTVPAKPKTYSGWPVNANTYVPVLAEEVQRYWPAHPQPWALAGQSEQETCISLTHRYCWNPQAKLETKREYGFGLSQFTVTYKEDGSERFNTWREIRDRYKTELNDWTWSNRFDARLQLRAMILYVNQLNRSLASASDDKVEVMRMAQSAYNGGLGGVLQDIKLCRGTPNCDPRRWEPEKGKLAVRDVSRKSKVPFKGYKESAFAINRGYVTNIESRSLKYRIYWKG